MEKITDESPISVIYGLSQIFRAFKDLCSFDNGVGNRMGVLESVVQVVSLSGRFFSTGDIFVEFY